MALRGGPLCGCGRRGCLEAVAARLAIAADVAKEKEPLSTLALARWTDSTRQSLTCPRCDIQEMISTG